MQAHDRKQLRVAPESQANKCEGIADTEQTACRGETRQSPPFWRAQMRTEADQCDRRTDDERNNRDENGEGGSTRRGPGGGKRAGHQQREQKHEGRLKHDPKYKAVPADRFNPEYLSFLQDQHVNLRLPDPRSARRGRSAHRTRQSTGPGLSDRNRNRTRGKPATKRRECSVRNRGRWNHPES